MDRIVLITGATSGIGEASAHVFAGNKFDLILTGRRRDKLETLAAYLTETHKIKVLTLAFDVSNREEVENTLNNLPSEWKNIAILVNNAGLSLGLEPLQDGNVKDWEIMIDTNVKGLLYVTKVVSNWMIKKGAGHIINLGSIAGKEVYGNGNVYCATKYAVDALTKGMRIDLLSNNIKVTAIHPGAVATAFSEVRFKGDLHRAKKVYEGFIPLAADDVAQAIWYAASRPEHVNINELIIMPSAQANSSIVFRENL